MRAGGVSDTPVFICFDASKDKFCELFSQLLGAIRFINHFIVCDIINQIRKHAIRARSFP